MHDYPLRAGTSSFRSLTIAAPCTGRTITSVIANTGIPGANGLLSFSHLQVCNIEQPFLLAFVVIVVSLHVTSPVTSVTYVNTSSI